MSGALSIAVGGIKQAINRASQAENTIVNASSTGGNVDGSLVALKIASTDVATNAAVIKTEHKMQKALLDILV